MKYLRIILIYMKRYRKQAFSFTFELFFVTFFFLLCFMISNSLSNVLISDLQKNKSNLSINVTNSSTIGKDDYIPFYMEQIKEIEKYDLVNNVSLYYRAKEALTLSSGDRFPLYYCNIYNFSYFGEYNQFDKLYLGRPIENDDEIIIDEALAYILDYSDDTVLGTKITLNLNDIEKEFTIVGVRKIEYGAHPSFKKNERDKEMYGDTIKTTGFDNGFVFPSSIIKTFDIKTYEEYLIINAKDISYVMDVFEKTRDIFQGYYIYSSVEETTKICEMINLIKNFITFIIFLALLATIMTLIDFLHKRVKSQKNMNQMLFDLGTKERDFLLVNSLTIGLYSLIASILSFILILVVQMVANYVMPFIGIKGFFLELDMSFSLLTVFASFVFVLLISFLFDLLGFRRNFKFEAK